MRRRTLAAATLGLVLAAALLLWLAHGPAKGPFPVLAPAPPSRPFGYRVPVEPDSPWPTFRRDHRNTGSSPLPARSSREQPWAFETGKGIFSTPVIDARGVVYVGSADHVFYAIGPDGRERWRTVTGEIIDSAGALGPDLPGDPPSVTMIAGDGIMRRLRTDAANAGQLVWSFDARSAPGAGFNDWFEGNVAIGFDGTIYAGNTNFNYYAISPDGKLRWTYPTGSNNWSVAAFADDGTIFWGSNDGLVHAVAPDGRSKWTKRTLGFIAASAAIGSDGTVYIGSFDSNLYALDPATGQTRWKFRTGEHVYASVALGADAQGRTRALYFGSADGVFYALRPDGSLLWQYDTGDPIRSSAALGAGAGGEPDAIVYFGSGNGRLYALDAHSGARRWSFDTTPADPELRDRNDLNGSPALGETGVFIGGEHGRLWYVPYDYCLRAPADARCSTGPGEDLPRDATELRWVTPGGNTFAEAPAEIPASTILTLRLVVRRDGRSVDARLCSQPIVCRESDLHVRFDPPIAFRSEPSADGRYLHIVPEEILAPATKLALSVEGAWLTGGWRIGNLSIGGRREGRFAQRFDLAVAAPATPSLPLSVGRDEVSAFEWTRLTAAIPPMLPSLNQIGFDYMDWIVGTLDVAPPGADGTGRLLLWAIGAHRSADGLLVADPASDFALPLAGTYRGPDFAVGNRSFTMRVTGIPIPFERFELRGELGPGGVVRPGAATWSESGVLSIPNFGPYLVLAGLANRWIEKLVVLGSYVTRPYDARGGASRRPPGVTLASLSMRAPERGRDGEVAARLRLAEGARYGADEHRPSILLLGPDGTPIPLDYAHAAATDTDEAGNVAGVRLSIPSEAAVPEGSQVVVLLDVFPLARTAWHETGLGAPGGGAPR